jgi:hypothetical protein
MTLTPFPLLAIDRCSQVEHFFGVSTLIELEQAIEKLPSSELRLLHRWIAERDADGVGCGDCPRRGGGQV